MTSAAEVPLLVVVGPTGSGKTALACRLAELCGGEIVSADSVQVYRHFDVGSAKPTPEERARARHHLVDIADPLDTFEAAQWAARAEATLAELRARNVRPIVCGGTFLWIRALVYGLAAAPPAAPDRRAEHAALVERSGRAALHERLARVDPESAARLHPNDFVRVSRALEVFELTGTSLSTLQAAHGFRTQRHPAKLVGIRHAPEDYDARLRRRCREMFDEGWLDEVRQLLAAGFGESRAMGAVGYRQVREYLQREGTTALAAPGEGLRELEEEVWRATRVFARRQRTWLRDQPVTWLTPEAARDDAELDRILGTS